MQKLLKHQFIALCLSTCAAFAAIGAGVMWERSAIADHDIAAHVRPDTIFMVHIDIKALRAAPLFKGLRDAVTADPELGSIYKEANEIFGFEITEGFNEITIQFGEDPADSSEDRLLITVSGPSVQEAPMIASINKKTPSGAPLKPVEGKPGRYATAENSHEGIAVSGNIARFGSLAEVNVALDAPVKDPAWTAKIKEASAGTTAFILLNVPPDESKHMMGLQSVRVLIRATDTLELDTQATFPDADSAAKAAKMMHEDLARMGSEEPELAKALGLSTLKFTTDGANLKFTVKASPAQLKTVVDLLVR